jgi:hypothetical protein
VEVDSVERSSSSSYEQFDQLGTAVGAAVVLAVVPRTKRTSLADVGSLALHLLLDGCFSRSGVLRDVEGRP